MELERSVVPMMIPSSKSTERISSAFSTPSLDSIWQMMTDFFLELANAEVREHQKGEDTLYELVRRVGTKG